MPEIKRGGWLLQLTVALAALLSLSLCAEHGDAAELVDSEVTEVSTKQSDPRANRAKRRGGTDVLRG